MIVGVLNTKGGVGKTTLAVNLAIARALAGRDVLLIDGDRQGSSMQAIAQRAAGGTLPGIAVAHFTDGALLRNQLTQARTKYDDVIIDAGGRDSTAMRAALMMAEVVVIPFLARSVDLWAMQDMVDLVDEVHSMREGGLRVYAVLNHFDARGADNVAAIAAVSAFQNIQYLDAPVGRRKVFADALGSGMSVLESVPRDKKSIEEINRLVDLVFISN